MCVNRKSGVLKPILEDPEHCTFCLPNLTHSTCCRSCSPRFENPWCKWLCSNDVRGWLNIRLGRNRNKILDSTNEVLTLLWQLTLFFCWKVTKLTDWHMLV